MVVRFGPARALRTSNTGATAITYDGAWAAFNPSASWLLGEASNSTTFADTSVAGAGGTLTSAGTGVIAGCHSLIANLPLSRAVSIAGIGRLETANNTIFDYSVPTAFSGGCTLTCDANGSFNFVFTKNNSTDTSGYVLRLNDVGTCSMVMYGGGNTVTHTFTIQTTGTQLSGIYNILWSVTSNWAVSPLIRVNGVAKTVSTSGTAPTTGITNAGKFTVGGRSQDGAIPLRGMIQGFRFLSGVALTGAQLDSLWTIHNTPTNLLPVILDTDSGVTDRDDIIAVSSLCALYRANLINFLGIICDANASTTGAPAMKAVLVGQDTLFPGQGFASVRVGAYQGSDSESGTGGPSDLIVASAGAPYNAQTGANYESPESFYGALLTNAAPASVVVICNGTPNAMWKYVTASAANLAMFNSKVKLLLAEAGQWPNSADNASPVGNFANAGSGEFNMSVTSAAAVDYAFLAANLTCPVYWCGIEMCGNTGNSPALADFIQSRTPSGWPAGNLLKVGDSNLPRTAWGQLAGDAAFSQATVGNGGGFLTVNDIGVPSITAPAGQNSSSAGTSNFHYMSLKLNSLTLAQVRTAYGLTLNGVHPVLG